MASLTVRNIPEEAKRRFRLLAAAHGRSMEEHLRQLVIAAGEEPYRSSSRLAEPRRAFRHEPPAYPAGTEPLPGESFVEHITRISRPGFDLEGDENLFALRDPYDDAG